MKKTIQAVLLALLLAPLGARAEDKPRLALFIGVDISGSFLKSTYYEDSLQFLANYIEAHLKGLGGLEKPQTLFVGSIGGNKANEPKSFYPIQTFQGKSQAEILQKLREIFPKDKFNAYTDFNAFFEQVADTVRSKKMTLKPVSVVLISDGKLDLPGRKSKSTYKSLDLKPLERLSRNITLRLLYTDAVIGQKWRKEIPRRRVRMWTQDALVMETWKDPKIFAPGKPIEEQGPFLAWVKDNVDFGVRAIRVD